MSVQLPSCPTSLRSIQAHLKIALEHDERDPVISYWCRLYALQTALSIDKKSDEAKLFLLPLMEWLENEKRSSTSAELINSDTVAQAYVENYALKLFTWADNMDRAGTFNKNVVKSFYTSGVLIDVLTLFGELSEDNVKRKKYASWKAAYIHNCLKNGETPVPGPQSGEENELDDLLNLNMEGSETPKHTNTEVSETTKPTLPFTSNNAETNTPQEPKSIPSGNVGTTKLDASQIAKAQKYCKFASSALNYDDIPEAVRNLQRALKLLQTGNEE